MHIYVAAALKDATVAKTVAQFIRKSGNAAICEWTAHYESIRKGFICGRSRIERIAADTVGNAQNADAMIVVLPAGFGTHIELGIALGLRKPVALIGEMDPFVTFYLHPSVVYRSVGSNLEVSVVRALPRLLDAHYMVRSNHG